MGTWYTGRLMVATPALDDPNFERAVVLILDHDEDGALGVVLNRASSVTVEDTLGDWAELAARPAVVFGGGPVEPTAVVALGATSSVTAPDAGPAIMDGVRLIDLDADPILTAAEVERVRIFAGYAGWGPDQLEEEIAQGAWFPLGAEHDDVFSEDPAGLWHAVLRRQPDGLKLLATFPQDPTQN